MALTMLVALLSTAQCGDSAPMGNANDGGADGATDAAADADPGIVDAQPDARVVDGGMPESTTYDFCGQAVIQLPIEGSLEETIGADVWGDRVVYSLYRGLESQKGRNIYLFDLASCIRYRLTYQRDAVGPTIRENTVLWIDYKVPEGWPPENRSTVNRYDLSDWTEEVLFSYPGATRNVYANGDVAAFTQTSDPDHLYYSLNLFDLASLTTQEVVPAEPPEPVYNVDWFHLGERYLVFTAYKNDPLTEGRDVFVTDLQTSETSHVDSTYAERQNLPRVWGDYAVWSSSLYSSAPPHRLVLYHLPTGEEMDIVADDGAATLGVIHGNVVAYTTDRYTGSGSQMYPADLEVYDIATGIYRRLTTEPGYLRAFRLFGPWLLALNDRGIDAFHQDYYVLDLEALGVLDASGHVIPGDPVMDPPPL